MTEPHAQCSAGNVHLDELPDELNPPAIDQLFARDDLYTARAVFARLRNFGYAVTRNEPQTAAWRPMEEAPKQSRILYVNRYGEVGHCSWHEASSDATECWWDDERDDEVVPLGWMPQLPVWSSPLTRPQSK